MNLKTTRILAVIGITLLTFLFHFMYDLIPCTLTSLFFPVNESIWEHLKMIATSIIFYGLIDYIILNKFNIKYNNFFMSLFITSITSIPIFLLLYMPLYNKIGPKMWLNIGSMIIVIIISQIISYYILKAKKLNNSNIISIILIIIEYIIFGYLTYKPIKCELFFDPMEEKYGINNYNI